MTNPLPDGYTLATMSKHADVYAVQHLGIMIGRVALDDGDIWQAEAQSRTCKHRFVKLWRNASHFSAPKVVDFYESRSDAIKAVIHNHQNLKNTIFERLHP